MTSVRQLKKETKNAKFIADMVFRQVHDQKIVDFFVYFEKNKKFLMGRQKIVVGKT